MPCVQGRNPLGQTTICLSNGQQPRRRTPDPTHGRVEEQVETGTLSQLCPGTASSSGGVALAHASARSHDDQQGDECSHPFIAQACSPPLDVQQAWPPPPGVLPRLRGVGR